MVVETSLETSLGVVVETRLEVVVETSVERRVENFSICAQQKQNLLPLKDCSLSRFLFLFFNPSEEINTNNATPVGFSRDLSCVSFEEFRSRGGLDSSSVYIDDALSSVGIIDSEETFIVPRWFIDAPHVVSAFPKNIDYIPLNITNIKRAQRIRNKLKRVNFDRFRLTVFRSTKNISAQIVDDKNNKTLVSATSVKKNSENKKNNDLSLDVAEMLAKKAL